MEFVSTLINGLSLGSIYALIALGYTMVYGIAKMLNFAHGDIIMVGAYSVFVFLGWWNMPLVAMLFAVVVCCALGSRWKSAHISRSGARRRSPF